MNQSVQEDFYKNYYSKLVGNNASGFIGKLAKYPHILLEKPFKSNKNWSILELGGGQGEHLFFVKPDFKKYTITDLNIDLLHHIKKINLKNVKAKLMDAQAIAFPDNSFDRIISTCLLSHIPNPTKALEDWRRCVTHDGTISIYLSTDPSIVLRIFRKLTTARKAKKMGFENYEYLIANEHINSAHSILQIIKYVFRNDNLKFKYRPFFLKSWNLNPICIVQVKVSK